MDVCFAAKEHKELKECFAFSEATFLEFSAFFAVNK